MFKRIVRYIKGNCITCGRKMGDKKFKVRYCSIRCGVIDGALSGKISVLKK